MLALPPGPSSRSGPALRHLADRRTVVGVAAIAVAVDIAVRSGAASLGAALAVTVAAAVLVLAGRTTNRQAIGAAAVAALLGGFTALRASPWLVPFDLLAAAGLLVLAASHASTGSLFDLHVPAVLRRSGAALVQFVHGPRYVARAVRPPTRGSGILRGAVLAAPLVLLLGFLLASADAVFASLFRLPFGISALPGHLFLLAVGAWLASALLRLAVVPPPADRPERSRPLGTVEASVVLTALVALYGAFALAQVVTALGMADHVISEAGLTHAEYARAGFFQLLAVSTITLVTLLGGRALVALPNGRLPARPLALAITAVALTLVIVAVAVARLHLYQQEFGLTMLRLSSTAFALWLAVVFLLLALSFAGVAARRRWFVPASAATALVVLVGFNIANPEAFVVRRNVELADHRFDAAYLAGLSDDAAPALIDALPRLRPADRTTARALLCTGGAAPPRGVWDLNASRRAADEARSTLCADD